MLVLAFRGYIYLENQTFEQFANRSLVLISRQSMCFRNGGILGTAHHTTSFFPYRFACSFLFIVDLAFILLIFQNSWLSLILIQKRRLLIRVLNLILRNIRQLLSVLTTLLQILEPFLICSRRCSRQCRVDHFDYISLYGFLSTLATLLGTS